MALTLIRRLESSFAAPRVKCSTGALEPAYAVYMPVKAARSEVTIVMILPPSWTIFELSCRIRKAAFELTLNE
jgi:hypothetical protein